MFTTFTSTVISEIYEKYGNIIRKNRDRKSCEILHIYISKKNRKNRKEKERRKVGSLLNQLMYSFVLSGRYLHYFVVYYIYGLMGVGRSGNAN